MLKFQYMFYALGIIFLIATVAYFAYEYAYLISDVGKTIILLGLAVVFFFLGEYMKEREI